MIRFSHNIFFILLLFVIVFTESCTVQKRVHRKGWFVQWHANQRELERESEDKSELEVGLREPQPTEKETEVSNSPTSSVQLPLKVQPPSLNNKTLNAKVLEAGELEQKSNSDGRPDTEVEVIEPAPRRASRSVEMPDTLWQSNTIDRMSPTRIPTLAWILLYIGIALVVLGIVLGIMFFVANGSFIGAPLYIILALISGILFLVFATQTALAPLNSQPTPPEPRYEKEEPKKEKQERQPLQKRDKIFLAVIAGLIAIIGFSLLIY